MLKKQIAKLKKVELRSVWGHEASDFTNWLSQEENLGMLSDELGITLKLIQTEANVGRYNVDILAEEENTGRKVIVENQLEDTNHDHLGKIITYASGYDAEVIVWIVKDYREEHQKAIDWLNEHTDEKICFYLLRLELWQIGNSDPAPKFEVIAKPNEWAKAIKTSTAGEYTETKIKQFEFWSSFKNYVKEQDPKLKLQSPKYQHWYDVSMGSSEAHIALTANSKENEVTCGLYINKNKDLYKFLLANKDKFEQRINQKIDWIDAAISSRVVLKKQFEDILDTEDKIPVFEWLYANIILLQKIFQPEIKSFKKGF